MSVHVLLKVQEKEVLLKVVRFATREHVVEPASSSKGVAPRTVRLKSEQAGDAGTTQLQTTSYETWVHSG